MRDMEECENKISTKICSLEDKLDDTEQYARRDTVILSGAIPAVSPNEDTRQVTVDLIKTKYRNVDITPNDISVCHRLQTKPSTANGTQKPPNIYVKFVRRDMKRAIIKASKGQARELQTKLFANESLTPKRTAILQTLLKIKRSNSTIKGVSSIEGQVYAFTAPRNGATSPPDASTRRRDLRHAIATKQDLQDFCDKYLRRPLEDFVDSWPPVRQV